ncbi:siderophore-iron reductase FhuF [Sinorhizobium sp. BG8]|nr:siderophore-iron reductase FhuF [Sinorhizobium sp. BG8]
MQRAIRRRGSSRHRVHVDALLFFDAGDRCGRVHLGAWPPPAAHARRVVSREQCQHRCSDCVSADGGTRGGAGDRRSRAGDGSASSRASGPAHRGDHVPCGVSQRLLWNNAAAYLSWIVGEIEVFGGAQSPCGKCLMENECWSDGKRNPLYGTIRTCEKDGNCFSCRKVCCLRYALPGVCGCGNLCPLPQGRA